MTDVHDERGALRSAVSDLLEDLCSEADVRAAVSDTGGTDDKLWARVVEMGVLELGAASSRAEAGASHLDLVTVFEEFGRALAPVPALSTAVALAALDGAPELRDWFDDVAAGRRHVAVALAVADDLSSPASPVRAQGPADAIVLSGELRAVADAPEADAVLVPVVTPDVVGLFLVPITAGATVTPVVPLDLTRPVGDIVFAEAAALPVRTDPARVNEVLRLSWLLLAAEQVGVARRALDAAVSYAKIRSQFGRTIGSFQAIKHACVDMLVRVEGGRGLVHAAAAAMDGSDPDDAALHVSLAAAYAGEAAVECAEQSLQIHGGIGFTWEQGAHLILRKAKADSVRFARTGAHWQAVTLSLERRALAAAP